MLISQHGSAVRHSANNSSIVAIFGLLIVAILSSVSIIYLQTSIPVVLMLSLGVAVFIIVSAQMSRKHDLANLSQNLIQMSARIMMTDINTSSSSSYPKKHYPVDRAISDKIFDLVSHDLLEDAIAELLKHNVFMREACELSRRLRHIRGLSRTGCITHDVDNAFQSCIAAAILDLIGIE